MALCTQGSIPVGVACGSRAHQLFSKGPPFQSPVLNAPASKVTAQWGTETLVVPRGDEWELMPGLGKMPILGWRPWLVFGGP